MSGLRTHWDPIRGSIKVATDDISNIRRGIAVPQWLKQATLVGALLGIVWVMAAGIWTGDFPFVAVGATTVLWAIFLAVEHLANSDGRKSIRRVRIARENGWSYTGKLLERVREFTTVRDSEGIDRRTHLVKSERMLEIERVVPELTKLQVGSFVGAHLDGEFWGESALGDRPFWLAVGSMEMNAMLAANPSLRGDSRGGRGGSGVFFSFLGAYRIDRKTGVRAVIKPENVANVGALDRDMKTESIAFNNAFHVSGTSADADISLEILRILSPATQDAMLNAKERYHNVGFVLDDDVLFFLAQDKLIGANASEDRIDEVLGPLVTEMERAAFGLKQYVE